MCPAAPKCQLGITEMHRINITDRLTGSNTHRGFRMTASKSCNDITPTDASDRPDTGQSGQTAAAPKHI